MDSEIANGRYRARPVSWALGRTSTGKEQVAVEFELMDADGVVGPHITWFGYFTDDTWERTVESLRHCGWQGDDLSELSGLDQEVSVVIENEEYKGKRYPKVRWVNAPGSGLALKEQLSPQEAKEFASSMRGRILQQRQSQGAIRRPATVTPMAAKRNTGAIPPEPPPHTDDDMPF